MWAESGKHSDENARHADRLSVGPLDFNLTDSGIGAVTWHNVELLRGVTYPVRDRTWGTVPTLIESEFVERTQVGLAVRRSFRAVDGAFAGRLELTVVTSGQMDLRLSLKAHRPISVCRAGFTLLHPIAGLVGEPLSVTHPNDSVEQTRFPEMISPSQPAKSIGGLRYAIEGCGISIAFSGDVFEMEDQRNWSDASYKTYCRPLALPYPYLVEAGETVEQSVAITFDGGTVPRSDEDSREGPVRIPGNASYETLPATALAVEAGWEAALPSTTAAIPLVLRIDLHSNADLPRSSTGPLDLELVTSDDIATAQEQLSEFARRIGAAGQTIGHIVALPRAYLKSYQPDAVWPSGAAPTDLIAAARKAFPGVRIGGGMLTNFTEFNRCRPDPSQVDFITHGSSAIVHAADDMSVFQTLEALPHIFASARAIASGAAYRLGLVSIGMRSNPYGGALVENSEGAMRTMTADDPRARSRSGAAWMVGACAATQGFGIERIVLAAPGGPFGILDRDGRARPSYHVVRALHAMAGLPRTAALRHRQIAAVAVRDGDSIKAIAANISTSPVELHVGNTARGAVLDRASEQASAAPDWQDRATASLSGPLLKLSPFDIAFMTMPLPDGDEP